MDLYVPTIDSDAVINPYTRRIIPYVDLHIGYQTGWFGLHRRAHLKEGETLLTLEAMKMFAAVASPTGGTVSGILVKVGESVESKDLLVRMTK